MTPYEVSILLHYYAHADDFPRMDLPLFRGTLTDFMALGLIEPEAGRFPNRSYQLTDRGKCYVERGLCAVPLPIAKWEIPRVTEPKRSASPQEQVETK